MISPPVLRASSSPSRSRLLLSRMREAGAELQPFAPGTAFESVIVEDFYSRGAESEASVLLCDLSPLPRLGLKGRGVKSLLKRCSIDCPSKVNVCLKQNKGLLAARLSEREVLLLAPLDSTGEDLFAPLEELCANSESKERGRRKSACWSLPRLDSFFWLALGGGKATQVLSKLCAVDFDRFEPGAIAQTSVARLSVCVIRDPRAPLFHLLADSASALYMWDCLVDAGAEHDAALVGRRTLLQRTGIAKPRKPRGVTRAKNKSF